jgi:hypothetical protein
MLDRVAYCSQPPSCLEWASLVTASSRMFNTGFRKVWRINLATGSMYRPSLGRKPVFDRTGMMEAERMHNVENREMSGLGLMPDHQI